MDEELRRRVLESTTILPEQVEMIKAASKRGLADMIFQMAAIHNDFTTFEYLCGPGQVYLSEGLRDILKKTGDLKPLL